MKKTKIQVLFFLFLFQLTYAQKFIKIGDSIMSEEKFSDKFETLKKEYEPNFVNIYDFEILKRNDSIVRNVIISVVKDYDEPTLIHYYTLLNKPYPDFKFKDLKNIEYSNVSFLNKSTIVCIWNSENFPNNKQIKKLNKIFLEKNFNVVAFVTSEVLNKSVTNKMKFPVFKNTSQWLNINLVDYYMNQYLIINSDGILTYLFPNYPNSKTKYKPMDKTNLEIFENLLN